MPCAARGYGRPAKLNERPDFRSIRGAFAGCAEATTGAKKSIACAHYAPRKICQSPLARQRGTNPPNFSPQQKEIVAGAPFMP
jgi:hypothetical protein